jgi:adenylate cyclase
MLRFVIANKQERREIEHASGPIEFGRGPARDDTPRCVVQDPFMSRDHVHVQEVDRGRIHVGNLSQRNAIRLPDGGAIATGASRDLPTPARLLVGETVIDVEGVDDPAANAALATIATPVRGPGGPAGQQLLLALGRSPAPETLARWFETVIAVQRAAAGSPEFYAQTARAVVELVGLDRGVVVLRRDGVWVAQARHPDDRAAAGREFSATVLDRVARERRTFFQAAATGPAAAVSLMGVEAVAASPIFGPRDEVAGAVYGCRTRFNPALGVGIGPLEAQMMQLLASTVGVGLARLEQEAEAGRLRVQFEQFFSADLARELQKNPRLLEGQQREVTVLFADIQGFTRMSQRLDPAEVCRLVTDVMERMTARVRECDGVLVDYSGDGLLAMWNAPADQPDHAARAGRAALAMLAELPGLDAAWHGRLGAPLRLGVGLNTGPALCGNMGTRHKFKYGPLGHAVNLASRVEGATRQLGVPLLVTGTTRERLGDGFAARRMGRVRLAGVADPVDLYELCAEATPEWLARRDAYEQALALYEAGDWAGVCRALHPLLAAGDHPDVPGLNLIGRSIEALKNPPERFDPVFDLRTK